MDSLHTLTPFSFSTTSPLLNCIKVRLKNGQAIKNLQSTLNWKTKSFPLSVLGY